MTHYWTDSNIHTTALTPRDHQVEVLASAYERNIILCLPHNSSKEFIALKLIHELGFELRRKNDVKKTVYISHNDSIFSLIKHLTDLKVIDINKISLSDLNWEEIVDEYHVIIVNSERFLDALICGYLELEQINLLVFDDCHKIYGETAIKEFFNDYYNVLKRKPKILGLAGPLHNAGCAPGRLSAELEHLERCLKSKSETASDIVTVLRYCTKPKEIILQCAPPDETDVTIYLKDLLTTKISFIKDHRFDPLEIYADAEFADELSHIPDPKCEPIRFMDDFLKVLNELGPWCADRAALALIVQIEKLKIKTPYERHFMLLCLVSTTFLQVRAFCDHIFQQLASEKERIEKYSSPKVLRLLEIFKSFKKNSSSSDVVKENVQDEKCNLAQCQDMLNEIDKLNFKKLADDVNTVSKNIEKLSENLSNLKVSLKTITGGDSLKSPLRNGLRPQRNRKRFPPGQRVNRINHYIQNDPEALCGLIFCDSKFITRILYSLFYEISKADPDLNYINVQYTVDKTANPITESKEAETEHRKQEEVLKRFRMHECNLLIGTSVLEEGIDLPKCNLVVRWDTPQSYRSYVQCKGRARAVQAFHIIFVTPKTYDPLTNVIISIPTKLENEFLNDTNHRYICDKFSAYDDENDKSCSNNNKKCVVVKPSCDTDSDTRVINVLLQQAMEEATDEMIDKVSIYMETEKLLMKNCENKEPAEDEQRDADFYSHLLEPYRPAPHDPENTSSITLANAVQMINKYCAKLPSDTFTKLTPLWRCAKTVRNGCDLYQYTIRLPINSPLKSDIVGLPMPTQILARRIAAFIACKILHKSGELDNSLQPIGKERFKAFESDWEEFELEAIDEQIINENAEPRPGTTKRRQYYYKRIASAFSACRPNVGEKVYLYHINMTLQCPIPEEQNTRGRKIYPPEESPQGFGILTTKEIPKVSAFPIFTRSGEVKVSLNLCSEAIVLNQEQLDKINLFINYTFTKVLRLQKYLMLYDPEALENCFFIVPTTYDQYHKVVVDWKFLSTITENVDRMPSLIPDEERMNYTFDANKFKDAVVMPWYRNQDQPQYFYVAEICYHLSPMSAFPGSNYSTFEEYYFKKYNIKIQNSKQPLLDVDHTSARLNFLTPRYVNRKGVALPTSSEETKKAKRENLEQKQILVPELCTIHPFPASLWRAAVCLPCILYRINALLLADEIRKVVANDLGLGICDIKDTNFEWPIVDFGWSLADVLKKSMETKFSQKAQNLNLQEVKIEETEANVFKKKEILNGSNDEGSSKSDDKTANDNILEEADKKLRNDMLEIGTWSNEMAENEMWGLLPSNVNANIRYGSPTSWDVINNKRQLNMERYYTDSEASYNSDDECDSISGESGLKIEFKSDHLAEAIESEDDIVKRQKQQSIINSVNANEQQYQNSKNMSSGFNVIENTVDDLETNIKVHEQQFGESIEKFKKFIRNSGTLVLYNDQLDISLKKEEKSGGNSGNATVNISALIPYASDEQLKEFQNKTTISLDDLYSINDQFEDDLYTVIGSGDLFDRFIDTDMLIMTNNEKKISIKVENPFNKDAQTLEDIIPGANFETTSSLGNTGFSFDYQPNLLNHFGPSPSIILQALTMSNANDGINLERLETIGDSFLKYAITTYLYCTYENIHEGKLSHLRSKQVSNLNLYRLGRKKILGESMIATKFEPHDNWLPPCYYVPKELEQALIDAKIPACHWNLADLPDIKQLTSEEICRLVKERAQTLGLLLDDSDNEDDINHPLQHLEMKNDEYIKNSDYFACFIPYNLVTQHSIPDKSVADCVEALIGAYLIECGPRGALLLMAWLGIRVLPVKEIEYNENDSRIPGSSTPYQNKLGKTVQKVYGTSIAPKSPLLMHSPHPFETLEHMLDGYHIFEESIGYIFKDRSYLLQAMTHASYCPNRLSDCYQRLEFLGDAVLDYLITRHLYEDPRQHSPGALTDLRSALVNNTIFASLAVRHGFHKYFKHLSPGLNEVIDRFVRIQDENGHCISEEYFLISEDECDEAEDVEVPKALGDVFESVAGAIFLDSNMSLDAVWRVYSNMMKPEIEMFSNSVPKSPIRELLELEPETAKFGKPEKLADGRRVRVTVEVFGKGIFRGIGRNYRIAKCTAAKCALRQLKKQGLINKRR